MTNAMARTDSAERARRRVAAAVAVLANALFLFALDRLMPARPYSRTPRRPPVADVLLVRLIDAPTPLPAIPESVPADVEPAAVVDEPAPPRKSRHHDGVRGAPLKTPLPASEPVSTSQAAPPAPAPTGLQLFDGNGQLRVPESSAPSVAPDAFVRPRARDSDALVRPSPLPYAATGFDRFFPPLGETLGRELVRKSTVSHAWRTPWGGQIGCSFSPLSPMSLFGCGWGYPPHASAEELRALRVELPPLRGAVQDVLPQADPPAR